MTDIVAAAFAAARYADALMRKTAAGPDEPHTDWQPKYKNDSNPSVYKWHPPYGETHIKYHIWRAGGGRNPIIWGANHHGTYQGVKTVRSPLRDDDPEFEMPVYSNEDEVEQLGRFKTPEKAKAAAEEHYRDNYSQPPKHDYDIDAIMGDEGNGPVPRRGPGDDEDYGHIFGSRRYAGEIDGPDEPHTDWQPMYMERPHIPNSFRWHPPYGETHARYHTHPMPDEWPPTENTNFVWLLSHDGMYQGVKTFYDENIGGGSITLPQYSDQGSDPLFREMKSLDEAKDAAHEHYRKNYPAPDHNYNLDQASDISRPPARRGLGDDEDYGHIFGMRRYAGDDDIHFGPDAPHEDWRPVHGDPNFADWHPYQGETHAHYRAYPVRQWAYQDRGDILGWKVSHNGTYNGMDRLEYGGNTMTFPSYTKDMDPDDLGWFNSLDEAKAGAEKHHAETYGQRPPPDYYDRHLKGDDLGEDYGNILGSRRTAGMFDWKPSKRFHDSEATFAHLENGHQLGVFPSNPRNPEDGWDWYVWHGPKDDRGDRNVTGGGRGWDGDDRAYSSGHRFPTRDHAQAAAEAAYSQLFPLGTSTGGHDSGVDYTQYMNPQDDLGDDYGNILGSRRYAAELSPPCPDCGQVAGFDTHPVSDRILVCRNCEYPMTDEGHDGLLDQTLSGHDRAISSLPETDHPSLGRHGHLDTADIIRLAGDGMSWEDTMAYIDQTLAGGEKGRCTNDLSEREYPGSDAGPIDHDYGKCRDCGTSIIHNPFNNTWVDTLHGSGGHRPTANIARLARGGMSWEETMKYIDQTLAEGEPEQDHGWDTYYDPETRYRAGPEPHVQDLNPVELDHTGNGHGLQCDHCQGHAQNAFEVNHVSVGNDYKGKFCDGCLQDLVPRWYGGWHEKDGIWSHTDENEETHPDNPATH